MATTQITTHVADALARLPEEHKGKANLALFITAVTTQAQDAETAWWALFVERQIDTAIGQQLDDLGEIVGQPRDGRSDVDYRRFINARIAANNSEGLVSDLIRVTRSVLDDATLGVRLEPQYPASIIVHIEDGIIDVTTAATLFSFMRDAASGGVRIIVHHLLAEEANTFTYGALTLLSGAHSIGGGVLTVDSTTGFQDTGSLELSPLLAAEEVVTYTSKDATHFYLTPGAPLANNHLDDAEVKISDSTTQGYADSITPTTGGSYSAVVDS